MLADSTGNKVKDAVDFWMSDRSGDCSVLLKNLRVENEKILKCCAHVILGMDYAINKVFWDTEQRIGIQKLLDVRAEQKHSHLRQLQHTLLDKSPYPSYYH